MPQVEDIDEPKRSEARQLSGGETGSVCVFSGCCFFLCDDFMPFAAASDDEMFMPSSLKFYSGNDTSLDCRKFKTLTSQSAAKLVNRRGKERYFVLQVIFLLHLTGCIYFEYVPGVEVCKKNGFTHVE